MQVTKEGIERIKVANDLAALVAERGIEVRRKGRVVVARCPFHEEKTPSFTITPRKGLYHCFGCGAAGDVIGFVTKYDKVSFGAALETLARRAGLDLKKLMEERPHVVRQMPRQALTPPASNGKGSAEGAPLQGAPPAAVLPRVIEHYHRTCEREDAQAYLKQRGLTDLDLLRTLKVGYADGSLLKVIPKQGEVRDQLLALGVITSEGRDSSAAASSSLSPTPSPTSGRISTAEASARPATATCLARSAAS
jgi:DNA primase